MKFDQPNPEYHSYVIVRSADAGVFAGYLLDRQGSVVRLLQARRIWYWAGAATLSELAIRGTKQPERCKFPGPVPMVELLGCCEILYCTDEGRVNIEAVPEWQAEGDNE
jgi:hypothetical protein